MHVRRRRAPAATTRGLRLGRTGRIAVTGVAALAVASSGVAYASTTVFGHHHVGSTSSAGLQVSSDQVVKPVGQRLLSKYGKLMGSAVSPDARFLAASSTDGGVVLQVFDLVTQRAVWLVGSKAGVNTKLADRSVGQEGPTFSPDGKFLWLPQTNGFTRFAVGSDGSLSAPTTIALPAVAIPPQPNTGLASLSALPGKAAFSPDGATVYVPVNGQDTVVALDAATGAVTRSWPVGIAPRSVVLVGTKLYVSNEGGRTATAGERTIESYGTQVPASTTKGTSTNGTVSVIDTAAPDAAVRTLRVGLHPTAMHVSGDALFVTNTFDDSVSVIDTRVDQVVQTISTRPWSSAKVGYHPNGVTTTADGHLLVTLGRVNALAVYRLGADPQEPVDYVGLLPTDYYPADVATTTRGQVVVTNTRGVDARGPELSFDKGPGTVLATGPGTHSTTGSLTTFALPSDKQVAKYTATVFAQNGWTGKDVTKATGRKKKAVAVPTRIGDPSKIKHVFLLVKENRTYDQVYGDVAKGNGDPSLAQFGANVTPNQHALADQFGLYDNFYDVGTNSAEGHNWVMQGDNPEYTESSAGEYIRSYDTENDVLGHQRSGFLWTAVQAAGGTARNYGEFMAFENKPEAATWQQYYCAATGVEAGADPAALTDPAIKVDDHSPIPSLDAISNHASPQFDTSIPDLYRYQVWKQEFESKGPANLNMMWLSSDHTGGPADPRAQVADGDLAVGKIVDEISHSRYWKSSAIFVVEDDSQDGADHVDGHRAPVQVISPWAKHGKVDSTYYSQITMVRTIEQILGAQPLNQRVAAATPMYGAFSKKADYTPFDAVRNQVPLTEGVVTPPACGVDTLGKRGSAAKKVAAAQERAAAVPDEAQQLAKQWQDWGNQQHFTGNGAVPDYAHPEQLNRYTWYQTHGWKKPYPGDDRLYAPDQVPGADIPGVDGDR
ncbi:40-residue YVTN family beta-propeller repeat-containing protein [Microlunatus sagamiharensis]|uniref:40-residue YVTN family beta-propeller repeat-containing protein n=1 Tax=Microlunatus sagamiharensis TaxID=546874 RepID=A0A1H2LNV4_9ACTN|nr:bifunctional YncE family protein/alkaline phosphatase family protein [Microlunatus sagamiharensis]SDU82046.1 40-residue YVTN family beta-propeller repeat-containing protein [Microlunatus sagamiharensis]